MVDLFLVVYFLHTVKYYPSVVKDIMSISGVKGYSESSSSGLARNLLWRWGSHWGSGLGWRELCKFDWP